MQYTFDAHNAEDGPEGFPIMHAHLVEMNESKNEECDPPPDIGPQGFSQAWDQVSEPDHTYGFSHGSVMGSDIDTEYRNLTLPNEDDDPQYFKGLLTAYRGGMEIFTQNLMDRGWSI